MGQPNTPGTIGVEYLSSEIDIWLHHSVILRHGREEKRGILSLASITLPMPLYPLCI